MVDSAQYPAAPASVPTLRLARGSESRAEPGFDDEASSPLLPGSVLGSYRIVDLIGEGGIGMVYLAEHVHLGRRVALKMMRSEHAANKAAMRRFFDEGRAVNRIAHENIVQITDFVEDPDGQCYIIMELLEGETLGAILAREGKLSVQRTLAIATQVASALQAAHSAGVVHRDLKPDNIFLSTRSGRDFVKLLDFGVAKIIGQPSGEQRVVGRPVPVPAGATQSGVLVGTPEYMSPEQARGSPVDRRTDVYAFGVILYEALTQRKPFAATTMLETLRNQISRTPPPPSTITELSQPIPPPLESLILGCLAKDAADRPDTMAQLERELTVIAQALETPEPTSRGSHRWIGAWAVGSLTAAIAVGYLTWNRYTPVEIPPEEAPILRPQAPIERPQATIERPQATIEPPHALIEAPAAVEATLASSAPELAPEPPRARAKKARIERRKAIRRVKAAAAFDKNAVLDPFSNEKR